MPYRCNSELPAPARSHLPPHAQDIYRESFNHAFAAHANDGSAAAVPIEFPPVCPGVLVRI
jgi:cation transport regulator ChaB